MCGASYNSNFQDTKTDDIQIIPKSFCWGFLHTAVLIIFVFGVCLFVLFCLFVDVVIIYLLTCFVVVDMWVFFSFFDCFC